MRHDPVGAKQHLLGLGRVQHHHDHRVQISGNLAQRARSAAFGLKPGDLCGHHIKPMGHMPGAQNGLRHAIAH